VRVRSSSGRRAPFRVGLRAYLFGVIAVVTAVPVVALGIAQADRWVAVEKTWTDQATRALAQSLANQLSLEALGHLKSVEVLAEELRGHLDPGSLEAVVRAHAISHPEDTGIALADANGAALLNVGPQGDAIRLKTSYADRPYFRRVLAGRRAFLSAEVILGRVTGVPNVHAIAPVLDHAGKVALVAIASIDLRPIAAKALAVASGLADGRVVVVDKHGRLIADSDGSSAILRDVSGSALFADVAAGPELRTGTDDRGQPARASAVAVDFAELGWCVVVLRQTASIARHSAVARRQAAVVSGLALIAALIVAGLVAGWLSRPVRALADAVEAVGRGAQGGIPQRIDGGPAEIAYLTGAVRSMVDNLRVRGEELEHLNATLEHKVEQRTEELTRNNRDMRLVLDNVAQGLLTVDGQGRLTEQRSAIVDRWFGGYSPGTTFADYASAVDPKFGGAFQIGHEAYVEGMLPPALCIDQLPTRLRGADREFRCSYSPLDDRPGGALLIVIDDVTQQLLAAEKDAEQRDLLALSRGVTRDRSGYLSFFEEGDRIVAGLARPGADLTEVKRLLHTLKGNAGLADLRVLADLCHRAEDEIEAACAVTTGGSLSTVQAHWRTLRRALHDLAGAPESGMVEVNPIELEHLGREVLNGAPTAAIVEALDYLRLDPVEPPFGRLARYAQTLGQRLGKGDITVEIETRGVRVNAQRWRPIWMELTHLVRNAIDHGIETTDERRSLGKPAPRLRLGAQVLHGTLRLEIEDDGRGIDWAAIKCAALSRGLPAATEADLVAALLSPGFSTRREVTATSGRGMGLSAVLVRTRELGGTIHAESQRHRGTRWSLSFPVSSSAGAEAMAPPLLVRAPGLP